MRDDVHPSLPPGGPDAAEIPDAELARRLARGDRRSLAPLYRRHQGLVYRFALLWTGSAATAADITQDVFLHLLTRACDFDATRGALSAWLVGIARNFARRRAAIPNDPPVDEDEADTAPALDEQLAGKRGVASLRQAIAELPPRYRDVLVLVELAERSYAEAALICGCELNTVRSRLSRARALLVRRLGLAGASSPNSRAIVASPGGWPLSSERPGAAPKD
jgi:RNA polymerase sigma-70 factor (ECF subfamily)